MAMVCSSARSTRLWSWSPTRRMKIAAGLAMRVRLLVRPMRFLRLTHSMRVAAFPISQSSTKGRLQRSFAKLWAIASMAATIAWQCAHGTSLLKPPLRTGIFCRARSWLPPVSPNCSRLMTRDFAGCLQDHRSNVSGGTGLSETAFMLRGIAVMRH